MGSWVRRDRPWPLAGAFLGFSCWVRPRGGRAQNVSRGTARSRAGGTQILQRPRGQRAGPGGECCGVKNPFGFWPPGRSPPPPPAALAAPRVCVVPSRLRRAPARRAPAGPAQTRLRAEPAPLASAAHPLLRGPAATAAPVPSSPGARPVSSRETAARSHRLAPAWLSASPHT